MATSGGRCNMRESMHQHLWRFRNNDADSECGSLTSTIWRCFPPQSDPKAGRMAFGGGCDHSSRRVEDAPGLCQLPRERM